MSTSLPCRSCQYSFKDLFKAAYGSDPEWKFMSHLYSSSREDINRWVEEACRISGWASTPVVGTDGVTYMAFAPKIDPSKMESENKEK